MGQSRGGISIKDSHEWIFRFVVLYRESYYIRNSGLIVSTMHRENKQHRPPCTAARLTHYIVSQCVCFLFFLFYQWTHYSGRELWISEWFQHSQHQLLKVKQLSEIQPRFIYLCTCICFSVMLKCLLWKRFTENWPFQHRGTTLFSCEIVPATVTVTKSRLPVKMSSYCWSGASYWLHPVSSTPAFQSAFMNQTEEEWQHTQHTPARDSVAWTHTDQTLAHTGFVLLIRLSQYQTSSGLGLWEARWELSGHSDWRKISLQISCGQKIWLIPRQDNGWSSLTLGTSVCAQIMSQQDRGECSYWSDPPIPLQQWPAGTYEGMNRGTNGDSRLNMSFYEKQY